MSSQSSQSILVTARSGEQNFQALQIQEWSDQDRYRRAVKSAAIGLGIAIASLFIPVAHFVLVPAALIGTPFVARFFYHQRSQIPEQKILCPHCAAETILSARPKLDANAEIQCDHCRGVLKINFVE